MSYDPLVIKSNPASLSAILVADQGWIVPSGGGSISFAPGAYITKIMESVDLHTLATDNAFGAGLHSLILNDGTNDVPAALVMAFLDGGPRSFQHDTAFSGRVSWAGMTRGAGLNLNVGAGTGWLKQGPPTHPSPSIVRRVTWGAQTIALPANALRHITINGDGVASAVAVTPNNQDTINLGVVITGAADIPALAHIDVDLIHAVADLNNYLRRVVGPISDTGLEASIHGPPSLQLAVASGNYYVDKDYKEIAAPAAPITFRYWYRNPGNPFGWSSVPGVTALDPNNYDNGTGVLAVIPLLSFSKQMLYAIAISETVAEFHVVYGQTTFLSLLDAQNGAIPAPPPNFDDIGLRIAAFTMVRAGMTIGLIQDIRPKLGQQAPLQTGITDHGLLSGRSDDDHPQYQLRSEEGVAGGYPSLDVGGEVPTSQLPSATTTAEGCAEIATQAEVNAGLDAIRYVTPATLLAALSTSSGIQISGSNLKLIFPVTFTDIPTQSVPVFNFTTGAPPGDGVFGGFQLDDILSTRGVQFLFILTDQINLTTNPKCRFDFYTKEAGVAGNAKFRMTAKYLTVGEIVTVAANETIDATLAVTNTAGARHTHTFMLDRTLITAADAILIVIKRLGADAADTFNKAVVVATNGGLEFGT